MELTFAELIERLIIANIKLTKFDHLKFEEIQKGDPNGEKIIAWERGSRAANEDRARARNAINQWIAQATGCEYREEIRTFQ